MLRAQLIPRSSTSSRPSPQRRDRKSTRLNSSHTVISYAVFCLKKKNKTALYPVPSTSIFQPPPQTDICEILSYNLLPAARFQFTTASFAFITALGFVLHHCFHP